MKCKIVMCNFFFLETFSFCLKDPNILLSGSNYGPKFNFNGHEKKIEKKLRPVTNLFLRVDNIYYQVWGQNNKVI